MYGAGSVGPVLRLDFECGILLRDMHRPSVSFHHFRLKVNLYSYCAVVSCDTVCSLIAECQHFGGIYYHV